MVLSGWMLFAAFLLVINSEGYEEWRDPHAYWSEKVRSGASSLEWYAAEAKECTDQYANLNTPERKNTWIAQKQLEGLNAERANQDYMISLKATREACDFFVGADRLNRQNYEEARRRLKALK